MPGILQFEVGHPMLPLKSVDDQDRVDVEFQLSSQMLRELHLDEYSWYDSEEEEEYGMEYGHAREVMLSPSDPDVTYPSTESCACSPNSIAWFLATSTIQSPLDKRREHEPEGEQQQQQLQDVRTLSPCDQDRHNWELSRNADSEFSELYWGLWLQAPNRDLAPSNLQSSMQSGNAPFSNLEIDSGCAPPPLSAYSNDKANENKTDWEVRNLPVLKCLDAERQQRVIVCSEIFHCAISSAVQSGIDKGEQTVEQVAEELQLAKFLASPYNRRRGAVPMETHTCQLPNS